MAHIEDVGTIINDDDYVILTLNGRDPVYLSPKKAKKLAKQLLHYSVEAYAVKDSKTTTGSPGPR